MCGVTRLPKLSNWLRESSWVWQLETCWMRVRHGNTANCGDLLKISSGFFFDLHFLNISLESSPDRLNKPQSSLLAKTYYVNEPALAVRCLGASVMTRFERTWANIQTAAVIRFGVWIHPSQRPLKSPIIFLFVIFQGSYWMTRLERKGRTRMGKEVQHVI